MPKVFISRGHLQNDGLGIELFPGDEVPSALVKASPWIVEDGLVIEKAQYLAEMEKVTAQDALEATLVDAVDSSDVGHDDAASAAHQGA
jgi:hypothetical protein